MSREPKGHLPTSNPFTRCGSLGAEHTDCNGRLAVAQQGRPCPTGICGRFAQQCNAIAVFVSAHFFPATTAIDGRWKRSGFLFPEGIRSLPQQR